MQWLRSKPSLEIPEIESVDECARRMKQDLVVFFKHSPTCSVSWMAHREVMKFLGSQPQVSVYLVPVRKRRDVAQYLAERTGITHESPQIIVMRQGITVADASHDHVTAEFLQRLAAKGAENGVTAS